MKVNIDKTEVLFVSKKEKRSQIVAGGRELKTSEGLCLFLRESE